MLKKILVFGARGNLGSQIAGELKKSPHYEVIAWTRKECDLRNFVELNKKITELKPAVIINTAAYNDVDACENRLPEQEKAITLNVKLVECLAHICSDMKIRLIHFSTNYVFSGEKSAYTEFDEPGPINFYGLTKLLGEKSIIERLDGGLEGCVIRVSNLFGPRGQSENSKPNFFEVIDNAARKGKALTIVSDEVSCFTYTRDVAEAVCSLINGGHFNGVYHFINTRPVSWYDAAKLYFQLVNRPVTIYPIDGASYGRAARRPHSGVLTATRTEPLRDFQEALEEYAADKRESL